MSCLAGVIAWPQRGIASLSDALPSGKSATWTEMYIARFANGKVVEYWANVDQLGMLTQLGSVQPPPQG